MRGAGGDCTHMNNTVTGYLITNYNIMTDSYCWKLQYFLKTLQFKGKEVYSSLIITIQMTLCYVYNSLMMYRV